MSRGGWYYGPGERVIEVGSPVLGFAGGLADDEDSETGRKRSISVRLARATAGAAIGASTGHLFAGRNLGLSKTNLITGKGRSPFSAKGLVPMAAGMALGSTAESIGSDVAGGTVNLVDSAFGQKKDQQS